MNPRYIEELSWRFAEVYEATVDQILINLARHFKYYTETGVVPSGAWAYQVQKLAEMGQINRETEAIILHMMGDADESLRAVLEASILDGLKDAEPALRKAAEKGLLPNAKNIPPVLNPSQTQAFQAYYAQSADKLNLVNTVMLQSTQAAYAATVADIATKMANTQGILNTAAGEVITGVTAWNKATKDAVKKMVDNGITGFIDHGGHHWTPEAYVAMDIRTTMANTARTAVLERNEEYGNDLYQVSYHNGARPLCYPWQGKVISMSGTAGTTIDGEGNEVQVHTEDEIESFRYGGGLFGVNCGHYPIPFVPEFSRIREPQQNFEDNLKEYEESQQQRRLERNLRDEKRDLEVMKAQGASDSEIKAQRQRVRQASKEIDDFCDETGRERRRSRETAPIRSEFPTPEGPKTRYNGGYISATDTPPPKGPVMPIQPKVQPVPIVPPLVNPTPIVQTVAQAVTTPIAQPAQTMVQSKSAIVERLDNLGIAAVDLEKWDHTPTFDEIVDLVGGADKTGGSCASAGLAYAGNKGGYKVRDFRGGASRDYFATKSNTQQIAELQAIGGKVIVSEREIKAANELLATMEEGREYWLGVGRHAAIVRKAGEGYEYLELQSATNNGWHALNDDMLQWRFGAVKKRKYALSARLMDVEKLANSDEFLEIVKYLNTEESAQLKGAGGGIK